MSLGQSLQQRQLQRLSPQQIQLMKLLQVPTAQIEQRIKEELEENPALEMNADLLEGDMEQSVEEMNDDLLDGNQEEEEAIPVDEFEMSNEELSNYDFDDDEVANYKTKDDYYPELDNDKVIPIKAELSLHEILMDQLSMLALEEQAYKIAEQIIGSLDDDGYLRRALQSIADDLAFKQSLNVEVSEIEAILLKVQQFDPPGIGARNLQECLLLQLKRKKEEAEEADEDTILAITIIEKYFEEFTRKHYDKIQKSLHLEEVQIKKVLHQIVSLNPKPGAETGHMSEADKYIIPDFTVLINNSKLELSLNSRNAPPLVISDDYKLMLKEYDRGNKQDKAQKEAVFFLKQKIDSARWFIEMILQRQQTLLKTMNAILIHQEAFFMSGDTTKLRPMILKDIAEKTNLDVSTVSRVANSKYVQTEFGTFLLKYFFSESLTTDSGEEVSTKEVKAILEELLESEDKHKPFSDDELTEQLQEKGYNIARRTVAKYREQLNIPVARLRKEL
ncbi:MAG: RNA polymerase factor sigma-54 [Bacteroidetes bacterium]|nr:RNA polymerase factor sigma-54 [Bacteroidota bacterium]